MNHITDPLREECINSHKSIWRAHYSSMKTKDIIELPHCKRSLFEYYLILGLLCPDSFYKEIEVAVPPNQNYSLYVRENILYYADLADNLPESAKYMPLEFSRKFYEKLHDNVLVSILGGYPFFENRSSLVNNIISLLNVRGWFVLIDPRDSKILNSDKQTTYWSSIEDLRDKQETVLAYGNVEGYYFYELDELGNCIHLDDETEEKLWIFSNPHGGQFSLMSVYRLYELLTMLRDVSEKLKGLYYHVHTALEQSKSFSEEDKKLKFIYTGLSELEKREVLEFLEAVFYMGMYMRRWKGPGHPYPIKEKDTFDNDMTYEIKITECSEILKNLFNIKPLYSIFYIIHRGKKETTLKDMFNRVKQNGYCIRMASKRFVSTAVWYRLLLMKETWPDIDINEVESIV